jgi:predicted permease
MSPRGRSTPLFRPGRRQAISRELEHHVEERVDRLVADGWPEAKAREEAWRRMGDVDAHRRRMMAQDTGHLWRRRMMGLFDATRRNARHALRGIFRSRGAAAALIATLALGIGATGALVSVVDSVIYRPLPFDAPERLVDATLAVSDEFTIPEVAADQVRPWTEGAEFLSITAAHSRRALVRTDRGTPEQIGATVVEHTIDELLGIGMARGRSFTAEDAVPGTRRVVLTHPYWRSLGSPPDVVGSTMELDGGTWDVIGVLPRGVKFPFTGTAEVWIPLASDLTADRRGFTQLGISGRLADGMTREGIEGRIAALNASLERLQPHELGWGVGLVPMGRWRANSEFRQGLAMVAGAVGLMFLISLFNALNLHLARASSRVPEISIRRSLGASRGQIVLQVLTESVLLALLAGVVATGVAWAAVEGVAAIAPQELTFGMAHEFGLEARALTAVFGVATLAGFLVGLGPALRLAWTSLRGIGQLSSRTLSRHTRRVQGLVVGVEVASSVVLLVGAGLFVRSFAEIQNVDLGMDEDRLVFTSLELPSVRYPDGAARAAWAEETLARVRAIPGVEAAVIAQGVPPEGGGLTFGSGFQGDGREPVDTELVLPFGTVGPGYIQTLGGRIVAGREFTADDDGTDAIVIDADLARRLFGTVDVAGRTLRLGPDQDWLKIVGVVEELRFGGVDDARGDGTLLFPMDPSAPPRYLDVVVRSATPRALLAPVRRAFHAVDDQLPLLSFGTASEAVAEATVRPRFLVLLMSILAGTALLLAGLGIYGVLAYAVSQQRREIGIRLALGAGTSRIQSDVLRWGAKVSAVGLVAGLIAASLLDDVTASLLFGIEPGDVLTRVAVVTGIAVATLLACWVPTRRAMQVEPLEVLASE